ncbi:hypothetical protein K438DRAFT_764320 [Mycena galopus ATCC 62051]|nr:hypothetical protein K438DRAFT_764320 [Mycena galopus ATCC 62051]
MEDKTVIGDLKLGALHWTPRGNLACTFVHNKQFSMAEARKRTHHIWTYLRPTLGLPITCPEINVDNRGSWHNVVITVSHITAPSNPPLIFSWTVTQTYTLSYALSTVKRCRFDFSRPHRPNVWASPWELLAIHKALHASQPTRASHISGKLIHHEFNADKNVCVHAFADVVSNPSPPQPSCRRVPQSESMPDADDYHFESNFCFNCIGLLLI